MRSRKRAAPTFGLFVEGAHQTLPRGWDDLAELWTTLCAHFGVPRERVQVHGITKASILALDPPPGIEIGSHARLDAIVSLKYDASRFDVLVIAFDALPPNQNIREGETCLRSEVDFVIERFADSAVLPEPFRTEAAALRRWYARHPQEPRGPGRPPRGMVEALYMAPKFEALILTDDSAWMRVFDLKRRPKDWPAMGTPDERLEQRLEKIVRIGRHAGSAPRHIRGDAKTAKHAWALEAVRKAATNGPLWNHPLTNRLSEILA